MAARRNGGLVMGTEAVRRALQEARPALLVIATDAAGRREELADQAELRGDRCLEFGTKATLGRLMNRQELGVMAVLDLGIAREVVAAAAHAMDLAGPGSTRNGLSEAE
jgi:ribosomal protein L30E